MNRRKLVRRLSQGAVGNVRFEDLADLAEGFGFKLSRVKGSHHIFTHPAIPGLLAERYNLQLGEDS